jgi:hypothetical protein
LKLSFFINFFLNHMVSPYWIAPRSCVSSNHAFTYHQLSPKTSVLKMATVMFAGNFLNFQHLARRLPERRSCTDITGCNVDPALRALHRVNFGNVADSSQVHVASIFMVGLGSITLLGPTFKTEPVCTPAAAAALRTFTRCATPIA